MESLLSNLIVTISAGHIILLVITTTISFTLAQQKKFVLLPHRAISARNIPGKNLICSVEPIVNLFRSYLHGNAQH
ncbi:MAG: hypothetical protein AB1611_07885 [bacterium]